MDEASWRLYRERVRADSPLSRSVAQRRLAEDLLARAAALDAHVTAVARALSPADFRAFLDVLAMLRASESAALAGPGADLAKWYAQMRADAAAGKADPARWATVDRLASVLGLADKAVLARQLAPPCPAAAEPAPPGPAPDLLAAAQPLFTRYSALLPQLSYGTAGPSLDTGLADVLAGYRQLRGQQPAGSPDWKYAQWWCAAVTGSLARSAAIQQRAQDAAARFRQAADAWDAAGERGQAADCMARAAEAALADGADLDQALDPLLRRAGPAGDDGDDVPPSIERARLLARLAQLYQGAGDHFDAGARAAQCAEVLERLGLADPARAGLPAAFAAWVRAAPGDSPDVLAANRTQALLSAAAEIWGTVTGVRLALGPAGPAAGLPASSGAQATRLLGELAALTRRLGDEAHQVSAAIGAEAAALGLPAAAAAPAAPAGTVRDRALDQQDRVQQLLLELNRLLDEFGSCEDRAALESLLDRAAALAGRLGAEPAAWMTPPAVTASVLQSDVLVQLGRLDEAAGVLAAAMGRLGGPDGPAAAERRSLLVTVIGRAAMVAGYQGDLHRMSDLSGQGIAEVELDRGLVNAPYLQDSYLRDRGRLYDFGTFAAHKIGDYDLMLARSELAKARGVLGWAVTGTGAASTADEQAFRALTSALATSDEAAAGPQRAERRVLWERLMTARSRAARGPAEDGPAGSGVAEDGPAGSGVAEDGPATGSTAADRGKVPAFRLAAVQAALAAGEAVIDYYWLTRDTLLITTIDRSAVTAEKITLAAADRSDLSGLISDLSELTRDQPWLDREIPGWGRKLLPSGGRDLLAGKERLVISPHRLLHQLPFAALDYGPQPLGASFAIRYVPNLTSLLLPGRPAAAPRVLALGVSEFTHPPLPPLRNAGPEAAAVARRYEQAGVPVTALIDGHATRPRLAGLRADGTMAAFSALHLVAHADDMPPDAPFDAALHLRDGQIDGLEISQWQLTADLVVLSACYSGRRAITGRRARMQPGGPGEELFGDEVYGLQAAFFAAGARQVLGALWPADDASARACMEAFHEQLSAGQPADRALQVAALGLRDAGRSLYHWAPYKLVCLGVGRRPAPATGKENPS